MEHIMRITTSKLNSQTVWQWLPLMLCLLLLLTATNSASAQRRRRSANKVEIPQVAEIDRLIQETWEEYDLRPSDDATDGEWCRRIYLDVIGRVPSVEELNDFLADPSSSKREALVNRLLYDERYTEEYARNWTTIWTNLLIGRSGGTERNSLTNRAGMQKYLRDSFARNKPYDVMVKELVTATGSTAPGTDNFNGAANYLAMKVNEDNAALATASVSQTFLGLQVQCTQCHNHPFNTWKQQKYWEMNAFFRQTRALRRFEQGTRDIAYVELVDQDYGGESGKPTEADLFYELRNGELKIAFPVFIDGQEIPRSGLVEDVNRRSALGDFILQSEYLDKTIVNRMWAHFLGYGFTKPIDDLGPHNSPSHPQLMDYLSHEFRNGSYNLKELIKWVTLSKPYQLSSKITENNKVDDPTLGESPKFSHFYLRQMRAEELYESLLVATEAANRRGSYEEQEQQKNRWLQQFTIAFGTDEGDETTTFNGTIPQVLMMFNGDLVKQATSTANGTLLDAVAKDNSLVGPEKIERLYMAALARKPTREELQMATQLLRLRQGDVEEALQDVWWAVLNSNEFILNH